MSKGSSAKYHQDNKKDYKKDSWKNVKKKMKENSGKMRADHIKTPVKIKNFIFLFYYYYHNSYGSWIYL